jgi:endonuclease/exonuclease/phosphatase family metal-dependent hydrolase
MSGRLRVMTYNVHRCVGADGRLSPERVADVLAELAPDVVALQELDVGRIRTGGLHQPEVIAARLSMHFHFSPSFHVQEERYGNALLSRTPIQLVREGPLPTFGFPWRGEQRGALWASIPWGPREVQIIVTHLGLNRMERMRQAASLLGGDWAGSDACRPPRLLCGDLNCSPGSAVHRRFLGKFVDAVSPRVRTAALSTYHSRWPFLRLDHVLHSDDLTVEAVHVPRSTLTRVASDHLPLVVDLRWTQEGSSS